MGSIVYALTIIIQVLILMVIAMVAISWARMFGLRISPYHPVVRWIEQSADLVLAPIRRNIPAAAGGIDFSPMIAIIILTIILQIIHRLA
jgi:YggT family protein